MKSSCLSTDKLHLKKTGSNIIAKNIISILKKVWYSTKHVEQVNGASFIDTSTTSPKYEEDINVTLKHLRHSRLNNVFFSYLNISSIRNNCGDLDKVVDGNLSDCNWTRTHKWFWVRVQLQSLKLQISRLLRARSSLTFRQL